jgi:hypothetical protein
MTKSFEQLLEDALAAFDALTPEQQEEMRRQQRDGWVKAEMQWAKDYREGKCKYD